VFDSVDIDLHFSIAKKCNDPPTAPKIPFERAKTTWPVSEMKSRGIISGASVQEERTNTS